MRQLWVTLIELVIVLLFVVGGYGWIYNIIKLIGIVDGGITGMLIARAIGVFVAPLGVILGFI